jgi:hypothetical protein
MTVTCGHLIENLSKSSACYLDPAGWMCINLNNPHIFCVTTSGTSHNYIHVLQPQAHTLTNPP